MLVRHALEQCRILVLADLDTWWEKLSEDGFSILASIGGRRSFSCGPQAEELLTHRLQENAVDPILDNISTDIQEVLLTPLGENREH